MADKIIKKYIVIIYTFIGIIILISVGVIFGFMYYDRDFALSNTKRGEDRELPGFAQYSQPSKEHFEQKSYRMKNDSYQLSEELKKCLREDIENDSYQLSEELKKCLREEIKIHKTKSGFLKSIEEKCNCNNVEQFLNPIDEGDKNKKSSHSITLLDALFYSSYSITTTGYGIIPLDCWIKLLTFIENIFEALIITGIMGSITNEQK